MCNSRMGKYQDIYLSDNGSVKYKDPSFYYKTLGIPKEGYGSLFCFFSEKLPDHLRGTWLDVGCGDGELLLSFMRSKGCIHEEIRNLIFLDLNESMLSVLRNNLLYENFTTKSKVTIVHDKIERYLENLDISSLGLILCHRVLQQINNWKTLLRELLIKLTPRGYLVVSETCSPFYGVLNFDFSDVDRCEPLGQRFGAALRNSLFYTIRYEKEFDDNKEDRLSVNNMQNAITFLKSFDCLRIDTVKSTYRKSFTIGEFMQLIEKKMLTPFTKPFVKNSDFDEYGYTRCINNLRKSLLESFSQVEMSEEFSTDVQLSFYCATYAGVQKSL